MNVLAILLTACSITWANAFVPAVHHTRRGTCLNQEEFGSNFGGNGMGGGIEEIEFTIYPDGRVVEVVRGVKGASCEKLTENIHKALGSVTYSEKTEEYFEQELVVDNTINIKAGEWDGSSSW
ncbi:hypothetical protein ACHAWO_011589 [Cyclotella atomus]|uniref:Uncharacterized protein n=1 Tax=Cyclotella atomus TaxID=382360 RepID=A0ABD3NVS4_9STRA